jgi:hypothetical protein
VLWAEDLSHAELSKIGPVVIGEGEEDVGPVLLDDLTVEELGPGGKVGVVGLEHCARRFLRRRHDQRRLTEPQHQERDVRASQF